MATSRQTKPIPRFVTPLSAQLSIADLSALELAEFIVPVELSQPAHANFDIADLETERGS